MANKKKLKFLKFAFGSNKMFQHKRMKIHNKKWKIFLKIKIKNTLQRNKNYFVNALQKGKNNKKNV